MGKHDTIKRAIILEGEACQQCPYHNYFNKSCAKQPDFGAIPPPQSGQIVEERRVCIPLNSKEGLALRTFNIELEHTDIWIKLTTGNNQPTSHDMILGVIITRDSTIPSQQHVCELINFYLCDHSRSYGHVNAMHCDHLLQQFSLISNKNLKFCKWASTPASTRSVMMKYSYGLRSLTFFANNQANGIVMPLKHGGGHHAFPFVALNHITFPHLRPLKQLTV